MHERDSCACTSPCVSPSVTRRTSMNYFCDRLETAYLQSWVTLFRPHVNHWHLDLVSKSVSLHLCMSLSVYLPANWPLAVINNHTCFHGSSRQAVLSLVSEEERGVEGAREGGFFMLPSASTEQGRGGMQGLPPWYRRRRRRRRGRDFPRHHMKINSVSSPWCHMTIQGGWVGAMGFLPIPPSERGCVSSAMMSWFILRKWCQASAVRLLVSTAIQDISLSYALLYRGCSFKETFSNILKLNARLSINATLCIK